MYIVLYDSTLARGTLPSWELFPSLLLLPHALMLSRTPAPSSKSKDGPST